MRILATFLLFLSWTSVWAQSGTEAIIEVNAGKIAEYRIPRTIFGTFLEPIGHSIYGGLWAQILENPSFEANLWSADNIERMVEERPELLRASRLGLPLPWEPLYYAQGSRYEPRWSDVANSYRSLLVMAVPHQESGVRQQVYLPVHRELQYKGSLWVKQVSGPGKIEVSFRRRNQPELKLAHASIRISNSDWRRYEFALRLSPRQVAPLEPVDFVIALANESRMLIDQVSLFPADAIDGMDPDMISLSRAMKTPLVRFGGNFTSGYHWRDGIGPMDKRVTMLNQAWGMPEYNQFGTNEFLDFCKLIGAEPQIALNLGSGTPEEAAGWVQYVNSHWGDNRGGLLWELGNELWSRSQIGYPTLERIAARTKDFSEAVRRVDPQARLIATGEDPDRFQRWNTAQLTNPPGTFNFLSTHFVVRDDLVTKKNPSPEFLAQASFALPVGLEQRLREMKAQVDATPKWRNRVKIAFTEWLFHGSNDRKSGNSVPRFDNMGGAVCAAGFLNTLMRVAGFTPISDMTGIIEFGGIWQKRGQVYGVPAYWALRMYSNTDAVIPVATQTTAAHYDVQGGSTRIPEIRNVPYLDVVGALNDAQNQLTLYCVNRHQHRFIRAHIRLDGFQAHSPAQVETLTAASIYDRNDEAHPEFVYPAASTVRTQTGGFEYTFSPASVTILTLR